MGAKRPVQTAFNACEYSFQEKERKNTQRVGFGNSALCI